MYTFSWTYIYIYSIFIHTYIHSHIIFSVSISFLCQLRIGFLYGTIIENAKVKVEVIYEPPQETTDISFQLLSDSRAVEYSLLIHSPPPSFVLFFYLLKQCVLYGMYVGCCGGDHCNVGIAKGWVDNCSSGTRKRV